MTQGVVTVVDRKYAVGLYWQPCPAGESIARAAREAAAQPGQEADFFSPRPGIKADRLPQFGLGWRAAGHRIGQPSLACSLANTIPGSWAGAFRVPEGYAIAVVRDDLIPPNGDELYTEEADALARLQEEEARGGLDRVYAPQGWAVGGADHSSLTFLLGRRADGRLQPIRLPRKPILITVAALAVIGAAGYVGYSLYQTAKDRDRQAELAEYARIEIGKQAQEGAYQAESQRQLQQKEAELEAQLRNLQGTEGTAVVHDPLWQREPLIVVWAAACQNPMDRVQPEMAGWSLSSVSCSSGQLSLGWTRTEGPAYVPQDVYVDDAGRSANMTVPLTGLSPRGKEPQDLWLPQDVTRFFLERGWPIQLSRIPDAPPPPPPQIGLMPGQAPPKPPPPPPWIKRSFTINTPAPPWAEILEMSNIPGVTITNLSSSGGVGYTLTGVIYEKR